MSERATPIVGKWRPCVRASLVLLALLSALAATACSGASSGDDGEDDAEAVVQSRPPRTVAPRPVTQRRSSAVPTESGNGDDPRRRDAADEVLDPDALIRRLDRLVAATDARMLRIGVEGDASSLSLDVLAERLQSAQARMRATAPVEVGQP